MKNSNNKLVYTFSKNHSDGNKTMKKLLGGKGANLAEMSSIGLPVPPGFTISAVTCKIYNEKEGQWPEGLQDEVTQGIKHIEKEIGMKFGSADNPLLVSVRSGAAISMPGMMDTVLNLGLNDEVVKGLAKKAGNERFAYDSYRRFIDMFGNVVMHVSHDYFEEAIAQLKEEKNVENDIDLTTEDLKELVERYKAIYREHTGDDFPQDPREQLKLSIDAVLGSWNSDRAIKYRRINKIGGLLGTAVNVMAMVYGNLGENSGTGVCFTRNPATGEHKLYGEFLINAQGEDVVAGIRTPQDINELQSVMPDVYDELVGVAENLEQHYKNMQDIEFTIQDGQLYMLQTRNGKRTGPAALQIAIDMVDEGLVSEAGAVRDLVEPGHLDQLLHPRFEDTDAYKEHIIASGLPASPGAAVGKVVFSSEDAEKAAENGDQVILVRIETSPEDVGGMSAAQGIITTRGGMTSHAAVVARGWGKPCVAGCGGLRVNYEKKVFTNEKTEVHEGDWISMNGSTGDVIVGKQELTEPEISGHFERFMGWVDDNRRLDVRANADNPEDASQAREFGAEGIGLCRTEHMFFKEGRVEIVREMIMAQNTEDRRKALDKLLPVQREDFLGIFKAMKGLPVTIRLLDPPLHEFLPNTSQETKKMAQRLGLSESDVAATIEKLHEFNPMLGHRGCRLGVTYPEITEMQTRAIIEAAVEIRKEGDAIVPEIMVPLVGTVEEFLNQKAVIQKTIKDVLKNSGTDMNYLIGTMIEIPRAALLADQIAKEADFFSFGTNDLTQLTYGYSRDDAGKFLPVYLDKKILPHDPFAVLDQEGVGQLVKTGTERGRSTNSGLKVGICGEHGGEPTSVGFFHRAGLNYVSCSPFRVPIARLAAAQANLADKQVNESAVVAG
jgi:pyruvate,orthophosphate dikinase